MTPAEEGRALTDCAQTMVASDGDLLAEVLRLGLDFRDALPGDPTK